MALGVIYLLPSLYGSGGRWTCDFVHYGCFVGGYGVARPARIIRRSLQAHGLGIRLCIIAVCYSSKFVCSLCMKKPTVVRFSFLLPTDAVLGKGQMD